MRRELGGSVASWCCSQSGQGAKRDSLARKLRDLSPESLVRWSIPAVELSVLGLVRHMQQMSTRTSAGGWEGANGSSPRR